MPSIWKAEITFDGQNKCLFATSERKVKTLVKDTSAVETVHSIKRVQMPDRLDALCDWLNEKCL